MKLIITTFSGRIGIEEENYGIIRITLE